MIAYFFPPAGVVGVYRPLKFIKYLPDFGWTSRVLTVSNGKFPTVDASLVSLVPDGTPVDQTWSFELFNSGLSAADDGARSGRSLFKRIHDRLARVWAWFTIPDNKMFWVPSSAARALTLVRSHGIDHVFITGKPFSSFLTGLIIKRFSRVCS